jgi:YegS/Rv2252/BmrU family lipid kinase
VTWEAGDAERFAAESAARGTDGVLAAGGDGTVNEVVNGLCGTDTPLAIVPVGTANDFAHQAGIPIDCRAALELALTTEPTRLDLGDLNGRAFLNVSTAGVGAQTTAETTASAKEMFGPLAYALAAVKRLVGEDATRSARFSGPGFAVELEYLVFAVGNARATGSGVVITPLASAQDGLLDVCVVGPVGRTSLAPLFLEVKRGEHLDREGVHYVQTPWLRVEAEEPVPVNVDGESGAHAVLEYRVRPGALLAHVAYAPGDEPAEVSDGTP